MASYIFSAWSGGTTVSSLPLEENERAVEFRQVMDRRAFDVDVFSLGIGTDEPVEVARLELVGVGRHRLQVADAEVAGAGTEEIAEGQRGQRRVAAGAPAADGDASGSTSPWSTR